MIAPVESFGLTEKPIRLDGGRGLAWRVGDVVLKPAGDPAETRWRAETLVATEFREVRVAMPVRAKDGDWIAHGWEAWRWVPGEADPTRIDEILDAANAFHQALESVPRPSFLDTRDDPWTYGDAVAWGIKDPPDVPLLKPLLAARRPVEARSQVVHGDLAGNVLFAEGMPPAIIDWPVYWRPTAWASAVAVIDTICWEGVSPDVMRRWAHLPDWHQMLIRALIYRIATDVNQAEAHKPVIDLVLGWSPPLQHR